MLPPQACAVPNRGISPNFVRCRNENRSGGNNVAQARTEIAKGRETGIARDIPFRAGDVRWDPRVGLHTSENTGGTAIRIIELRSGSSSSPVDANRNVYGATRCARAVTRRVKCRAVSRRNEFGRHTLLGPAQQPDLG